MADPNLGIFDTILRDFANDGMLICKMIAMFVFVEMILTGIVVATAPNGVKDRLYYSSCIICIPKVVIMFYYAWNGVMNTFGTLESRTFSSVDFNTSLFSTIYIAHSIGGIINEAFKDGVSWSTMPMFLHHVASIVSFAVSMHTQRFCVYASFCGLCEITNIPLSIMYLSKTKGGGVAEWMERNFGILLSVNGGMLWLTFFVFRVIMFPYVIYNFLSDLYLIRNDPRNSQVWLFEIVYHPLTMSFLWCISMMWFSKIHAGFMKVLRGEMSAAKAAPEKAE